MMRRCVVLESEGRIVSCSHLQLDIGVSSLQEVGSNFSKMPFSIGILPFYAPHYVAVVMEMELTRLGARLVKILGCDGDAVVTVLPNLTL
jgi:hypothetical protein